MFMIPLADLLNYSLYADIKYEFLDSKNLVMKYTSIFNDNNNLSKNIISNNLQSYTDFLDFFKYFKNTSQKGDELKIIKVNYKGKEENKNELTNDDYFVISTNEQSFKKIHKFLIIMAFEVMNIFL